MNNSHVEAEISFRFLSLDKFQAYSLVREILGSTHKAQVENKSYVAYVPLTKENFEQINDYYVRQRIEITDCDIFISVADNSITAIVDIPVIVNRMLKYIDCKLTISLTAR